MINSITAYDIEVVKKKLAVAKVKTWYKGKLITSDQYSSIQTAYETNLFSPSIIIRVLLFIATYLGLSTIVGPIALMVGDAGMGAIRVMLFITGAGMMAFVERILIKDKHHFKSGVTEAGYYSGLAFIYFGLLGFEINEPLFYLIAALILLAVASIRYLDLLSLISAMGCLLAIIFLSLESILSVLPFAIMIVFAVLFAVSQPIQKKLDYLIWEDHFIIFDTLSLLLVYLGGNYFVVRELSIEMMNLSLAEGQDIPFAFLFYGFTLIIPIAYLVWGIKQKSILFIRVSLIVIALSVITIKYYYSFGHPEITVTVAGAVLILVSLLLIKYLKKNRNGFIRDQIFKSKWDNTDLAAFIASQSLGGHQINESESTLAGQGGEFGGGGASGEF